MQKIKNRLVQLIEIYIYPNNVVTAAHGPDIDGLKLEASRPSPP